MEEKKGRIGWGEGGEVGFVLFVHEECESLRGCKYEVTIFFQRGCGKFVEAVDEKEEDKG